MKRKTYSIIITPTFSGTPKTFSIPKSTLYYIAFFIIFLVAVGILGIFENYRNNKLVTDLQIQKTEKQYLRKVLKVNEERLRIISKTLEEIKKKEGLVRDYLGIGGSEGQVNAPGQGGPELEDVSFYEPEVLVCRSFPIYEYGKDWDYFLKSSYSLEDDLQELLDVLDEQKEKWNTLPSVLPVKTDNYWFSSGFGWRKSPFTGLRHFHSGLDISAKRGTPIIATADGIVSSVKHEGPLGKTVRIRHNAQYSTVYGHMLKYAVKRGKSVKRGQIIGYVGNTGRSTGYHVHYEVKKNRKSINPFNYILNTKKSGTLIASK